MGLQEAEALGGMLWRGDRGRVGIESETLPGRYDRSEEPCASLRQFYKGSSLRTGNRAHVWEIVNVCSLLED